MTGEIEVIVFPSTFAECSEILRSDLPLVVLGTVQQGERGAKIIAQEISLVQRAMEKYTEKAVITLQAEATSRQHLTQLKEILYRYHGLTPLHLTLHFDGRGEVDIDILKDLTIKSCPDFIRDVVDLCGSRTLSLRMKNPEVKRRGNGKYGYKKKAHA